MGPGQPPTGTVSVTAYVGVAPAARAEGAVAVSTPTTDRPRRAATVRAGPRPRTHRIPRTPNKRGGRHHGVRAQQQPLDWAERNTLIRPCCHECAGCGAVWPFGRPCSDLEHRPAELVPAPLVVEHEPADLPGQRL